MPEIDQEGERPRRAPAPACSRGPSATGSAIQASAVAPGTTSNCAAGPARVCQQSRAAASSGEQRRSPPRGCSSLAVAPVAARASAHSRSGRRPAASRVWTVTSKPCRQIGIASRTLESQSRSSSGELCSSRPRHCGAEPGEGAGEHRAAAAAASAEPRQRPAPASARRAPPRSRRRRASPTARPATARRRSAPCSPRRRRPESRRRSRRRGWPRRRRAAAPRRRRGPTSARRSRRRRRDRAASPGRSTSDKAVARPSVDAAARALRVGQRGHRPGEQARAASHDGRSCSGCHMPRPSRRRRARRWRADRRCGATSRRTVTAIAAIATSIGSSGATATAICSAVRPPNSGVNSSFSAGDRQVDEPRPVDVRAGQAMLGRSYQPWPASRARTCIDPHIVVGVAEREGRGSAPPALSHGAMKAADDRARPQTAGDQRHCTVQRCNSAAPAPPRISVSFLFKPRVAH